MASDVRTRKTLLDDATSVEGAIDRLGHKVQPDHFFQIKARKLSDMAAIRGEGWTSRLTSALTVLCDMDQIQSVVTAKDGVAAHVYMRRGTELHPNTCAPMFANDVQAICAMVGGKGLSELEAIPRNQLTDLRKHGCTHHPSMQECLQRILVNYTEAGHAILTDNPHDLAEFIERGAEARARRQTDLEKLLEATAEAETEEPEMPAEIETEPAEIEEEEEEEEEEEDCPRCGEAPLHNGNQVCEACVTELLKAESDGPERATADRRGGGKVLVGGMTLEPERIRRLLGRAVRVTREIQNTMLPPLTDELEEDEEPLSGLDRGRLLHQVDARVSDMRSILSQLRAEFVEDTDHTSRLSQFGRR